MPNTESLKQQQVALARAFKQVFTSTPEGKQVLAYLATEFYHCNLMGATDSHTNRNIGQRDVVMHINEIITIANGAE